MNLEQSTDSNESTADTGAVETSAKTLSVVSGKLKARQAFETTDGKTFFDAEEAAAHQSGLDNSVNVERFLAKENIGVAQAGMLRNMIPKFLAFADAVANGYDTTDLDNAIAAETARKAAEAKAKADEAKAKAEAEAKAAKEAEAAKAASAA